MANPPGTSSIKTISLVQAANGVKGGDAGRQIVYNRDSADMIEPWEESLTPQKNDLAPRKQQATIYARELVWDRFQASFVRVYRHHVWRKVKPTEDAQGAPQTPRNGQWLKQIRPPQNGGLLRMTPLT
jgi:hypothetical protein